MIAAARRHGWRFGALRPLAVLAACALLGGCVTDSVGDAADYVGSVAGVIDHAPPKKPSVVQIFIASTRKGESGAAAQQASTEGTRYALSTLTFPPGHQPGVIERPM